MKLKLPILSVIIPAYNAKNTIPKCLDSILESLTDHKVEIICVDDGSTDATWQILKGYEKRYAFIHCIHKENGGVGSARNVGLAQATGDYIAWVDSDDYVAKDWYPVIRKNLMQYHPDCFFFDYFSTSNGVASPCHIRLPERVSLQKFVYEQSLERELKNFLCNQVIASKLIKKVHFSEEYHMLEDYDVLTSITPEFRRIVHGKQCLYHYVQRKESLTHKVDEETLWKNIEIVKTRFDQYQNKGLKISPNDYYIQLLNYIYVDTNQDKKKDRVSEIINFLRKNFYSIIIAKYLPKKLKVKAIFVRYGMQDSLVDIIKWREKHKK